MTMSQLLQESQERAVNEAVRMSQQCRKDPRELQMAETWNTSWKKLQEVHIAGPRKRHVN